MPALASSFEGQVVERSLESLRRNFDDLESYGVGALLERELPQVWSEVSLPDWDGYGALPVERSAFEHAADFVRGLPIGTPMPEVGAEPDGHLTLEWYRAPRRILSLSFAPDGSLHYAALSGPSDHRGSIAPGGSPRSILQHLGEIV